MDEILQKLSMIGIVPVIALENAKDAVPLAKALRDGGINCAEITFRTTAAEESIRLISEAFPDMLIAAGTVLTTEQVDRAVHAGAEFIVSPGLNPKIVKYCKGKGIFIIPGVSTPSEIETALELGLDVLKFFPAQANGGLAAIKAICGPYPTIRFMPTGGINGENVKSYLDFEKVIACGGSWMIEKAAIKEGNFQQITQLTKEAVKRISMPQEEKAESKVQSEVKIEKKENRRIITFGEIMLRLAPEGYTRFVQSDKFGATYGGGEANVAVSLANFGMDVGFVTKLPTHEIGQAAVNSLRRFGVDTKYIARGGDRVGVYFLEKGASQRPSKVIYDRAGSSIATASATDFNWEEIFRDVDWFHFTGITPALGDHVAEICKEACKEAKKRKIGISCDLNYRKKLWSKEKAGSVMAELCRFVDVCIANEEDAADVFGIRADNTDVSTGQVNHEGYKEVAKQLAERFGFSKVAITLRSSISASDNQWAAMLYDGKTYYFSKSYSMHIVDRVGGGDSFGAGLIYAILNGYQAQDMLEFAVAASCLKHTVEGDFNIASVEEVLKLANGDGSGRVQR